MHPHESHRSSRDFRIGFRRLRRFFLWFPFILPLTVVVCSGLALQGVQQALYVLTVVGIVWLSARVVKTWNEFRLSGSSGFGRLDLGGRLANELAKCVERGMAPDDVISTALGFGIGAAMAHFSWNPRQIADVAQASAEQLTQMRDSHGKV